MYGQSNEREREELTCHIHLLINSFTGKRGGMDLQVESWNSSPRRLALRETFTQDDGAKKYGKAKGLSIQDLKLIQDNWDKIIAAMEAR